MDDTQELAKKLSNPIASLISLPFQSNYDWGLGPNGNGTQYKLNIQPVIPISINSDWNVISRTIVPVTIQNKVLPMMPNGDNDQAGIGDTMVDSTGAFINQNDDGGSNVPADSVTGSHFDTFLQALLAPGNYTVSVMAFSNFANGPNLSNGFTGTGSFVDVNSNQRDSHWAFDILNVGAATEVVPGVPEPSTWAMMMLGFGVTGFAIRRSRRKADQKQIPRAI